MEGGVQRPDIKKSLRNEQARQSRQAWKAKYKTDSGQIGIHGTGIHCTMPQLIPWVEWES